MENFPWKSIEFHGGFSHETSIYVACVKCNKKIDNEDNSDIIVTLLCLVIAYVMWLKLANHVILTTCLEIRLACKLFEADESLVLLNFKIPTTLW